MKFIVIVYYATECHQGTSSVVAVTRHLVSFKFVYCYLSYFQRKEEVINTAPVRIQIIVCQCFRWFCKQSAALGSLQCILHAYYHTEYWHSAINCILSFLPSLQSANLC